MDEKRQRKTFRHHLVLTSALSTSVFAILVAASLFFPLASQLDRSDLGPGVAGGLAEHFLYLHMSFWPVVAGALIASIVSGMLLYQRMTGPLARFIGVFRRVSGGDVPGPLTLRRADYLSIEAEELNRMLEGLAELAADREARASRCEVLLDEMASLDLGERGRTLVAELLDALKGVR